MAYKLTGHILEAKSFILKDNSLEDSKLAKLLGREDQEEDEYIHEPVDMIIDIDAYKGIRLLNSLELEIGEEKEVTPATNMEMGDGSMFVIIEPFKSMRELFFKIRD